MDSRKSLFLLEHEMGMWLWLCLCALPSTIGISNGDLRLVNHGGSENIGLLQVWYANRWGTVCDDGFTPRNAEVACNEMGFPGGSFWGYGRCHNVNGRNECGTGQIWMDNVNCHGSERRLQYCRRLPWGWHNCGHREDVVLKCNPRPKWWIEWSTKDSTEDANPGRASYIVAVLKFAHRPSVQMAHWCWRYEGGSWRQNFDKHWKVITYGGDGTSDPNVLKNTEVLGVWFPDIYFKEPFDYLFIKLRGVTCTDVMPYIKAVSCEGNRDEEVSISSEKSRCWERGYEKAWDLNYLQTEVKLNTTRLATNDTAGAISAANTTDTSAT